MHQFKNFPKLFLLRYAKRDLLIFRKISHRWAKTNVLNACTLIGMQQDALAAESLATTTVAEARRLHPAVGRGRLYQGLATGSVRNARVGRRIAIDLSDLHRWVLAGCPIEGHQHE